MGLGVREGLSIYFLAIFGVSAPAALSAAFLFFLINNVSISIIGVLYLGKVEMSPRDIALLNKCLSLFFYPEELLLDCKNNMNYIQILINLDYS